MNREDIIRMAREAGMPPIEITSNKPVLYPVPDAIERFAALVAAHIRETEFKPDWNNYRQGLADGAAEEREACAKVCDDFERAKWLSVKNITQNGGRLLFAGPMHCAAAIRARGQA